MRRCEDVGCREDVGCGDVECRDVEMWNVSPPLEESETKIRQRIAPSGEKEDHQESRTARSTAGYRIKDAHMSMMEMDMDTDVE